MVGNDKKRASRSTQLPEAPDIPSDPPIGKGSPARSQLEPRKPRKPKPGGDIPLDPPIGRTGKVSGAWPLIVLGTSIVVAFAFLIVLTIALMTGHVSEHVFMSITMSVLALLFALGNLRGRNR